MELWNRYTAELQTNGNMTESEFALKRAYFRLEPKFSDTIKGRFNFDMFSDDGAGDGAGLKLKYAYLTFSKFLLPFNKLTVGLQKNYFGTIYTYEYDVIEKDPSDLFGIAPSSDYGITMSGDYPMGFGDYQLGIYNGEGYKATGSAIDIYWNYLFNTHVIILPGVTIGGTLSYQDVDDSGVAKQLMKSAVIGNFVFNPIQVSLQYLHKYDEASTTETEVTSGMLTLKLGAIDVLGRLDYESVSASGFGFLADQYVLNTGITYYVIKDAKDSPVVWAQLNYEAPMTGSFKTTEHKIMAQLRWKFSSNI